MFQRIEANGRKWKISEKRTQNIQGSRRRYKTSKRKLYDAPEVPRNTRKGKHGRRHSLLLKQQEKYEVSKKAWSTTNAPPKQYKGRKSEKDFTGN